MTDASQPWDGVPLHPETRRFHLLRHRSSGDEKVGEWWPPGEDAAGPFKAMWFGLRWGMPEHVAAEYEYLGPLYTQADADALAEAAAAEIRASVAQASPGWLPINDGARAGGRILLVWRPFQGVSEHVELGRWNAGSGKWVNTYGRPFGSDDPDGWAPLAPFPSQGALEAIRAEERRIIAGLRDGSLVAVPREPTEAMLDRAGEVIVREFAESDWEEAKEMAEALNPRPIWDAMLAAAEPPR